jgi:hypothetical protein
LTHDKQNTDRYLDNFAVTSRAPRSRKLQLSMVLSMVALFAQLWMGQVSAGHMAQMLSEQFMRGDICSVQDMGTERPDGLPSGHTMGGTLGCPVCSVAAASFTPGNAQAVQEPPPALAVYGALFTSAPPGRCGTPMCGRRRRPPRPPELLSYSLGLPAALQPRA